MRRHEGGVGNCHPARHVAAGVDHPQPDTLSGTVIDRWGNLRQLTVEDELRIGDVPAILTEWRGRGHPPLGFIAIGFIPFFCRFAKTPSGVVPVPSIQSSRTFTS